MNSQADCASFYNCKFRSFQDTWMTANNDVSRHYVKDCWIEGAVDYFYGGGDVLLENCTLYNVCVSVIFSTEPERVFKLPVAYPTVINESMGVTGIFCAKVLSHGITRRRRL